MTTAPATQPERSGAVVIDAPSATRRELRERRRSDESRESQPLRTLLSWTMLLVAVALLWPSQLGGLTGLTVVHGQSMEPTYSTGDVVVTLRQPGYGPGDVISYEVPDGQPGAGGHVIHRVHSIGADGRYLTIGDNNDTLDAWTITDADVIGKAVLHLPGAGVVFTPQVLPYVVAMSLGAIVTVLLWGPGRRDQDDDEDADSPEQFETDRA